MTRRTSPALRPPKGTGLPNVAECINACARDLERGGVFFGHGTGNSRDEAAAIVFHCMGLDHADQQRAYAVPVPPDRWQQIAELVQRRIAGRVPLPYLLGEAWFAGLPFYVDERVLVPRSPLAELILGRFAPWVAAGNVRSILDIGTGSGCIAIACAVAFPGSRVVATDISAPALEVAQRNVLRHGVEDQVELVQSDLFARVAGRFDLIVTNPPYVPEGDIDGFPPEYAHEPRIALAAGSDGLETPAGILQHAAGYLSAGGWLALEVGEGATRLEARFPAVPFIWPELAEGGDGVALVRAADLPVVPA